MAVSNEKLERWAAAVSDFEVLRRKLPPEDNEIAESIRRTREALARVRELGREHFSSGRYAEACKLYGEGLKYNTRDHILYCNRAICWSKLGLWEQSVKDCDQALKIEPSYTKARFHRAVSNEKLERWAAAMSDFEVLRGELPEDNEIAESIRRTREALARVRELAREHFSSGRYAEACKLYGEGLKYNTRDHILYCNRAICWSKLGLWEQSVKDCDQALKIEPSYTKARFRRAVSNEKLERWAAAMSDFEVLRGELPEDNEIAESIRRTREALARVRELAREHFSSGRYAEACKLYGEGLKYNTRDHILYCNRAICWSKLGLWEQSVKDCDQALKIEPSYTKARFRRAVSNEKLERWAAAMSDFEVLRGELPEDNEIAESIRRTREALARVRELGSEHFSSGRYAEACKLYGEGLKYNTRDHILYCNRAICWSKLGLWEQSVKDCDQALKIEPSYTKARFRRAVSNEKLGRWAAAVSDFEVLRGELPENNEIADSLRRTQEALNKSYKAEYSSIDPRVEKGTSPLYEIPKEIKHLIEKDIVPGVLKKPLSPSTYKEYFAALLYAEDYYHEKWEGFKMENVTLELHEAAIYDSKRKTKNLLKGDGKEKLFVVFEMDAIPERRPFLLSRDFAYLRSSNSLVETFKGIIYGAVKSNLLLVEFGEDFHSQHHPACTYDIKFSFNRVCLKRAHQAVATVSDDLLKKFIFPDSVLTINPFPTRQLSFNHKLDTEQVSAVRRILSLQGSPPYLVEGPLSVKEVLITDHGRRRTERQLSRTGIVVREAVLNIHRISQSNRILICAPVNSTCDMLMVSLQAEILESDMHRANAAFRERESVHEDILPSCHYEGECFSLPPLHELQKFKVIFSTFMSSFRLRDQGLTAGHFSNIFLVDASSATEPETLVVLSNLANERTAVVVTGAPMNRSGFIRSNIARENGLMISYFERLRGSKLYNSSDSKFIAQLGDTRGSAYLTDS